MKHKLQGNRIAIRLENYKSDEQIGGLRIPLYVEGVTDGGQARAQINEFPLAPVGIVEEIAPGAVKTIEDLVLEIKVGDRVSIQPHSLTRGNYYYMNPDEKVIDITDDDERRVAVHPANIISIIED